MHPKESLWTSDPKIGVRNRSEDSRIGLVGTESINTTYETSHTARRSRGGRPSGLTAAAVYQTQSYINITKVD